MSTHLTPEQLREHLNAETEEDRILVQATEQLDSARFAKVMAMTAQRFVKLSAVEKRNYLRWAEHFRKTFESKEALFRRHTPPDIDVPTFLQVRV